MEPREGRYLGVSKDGFHRLAYVEWGDPKNERVLVCVHGLTRQGRDFDPIARSLADRHRVVCPDIVGRGKSDWLADKSGYNYPQYWSDLASLIARLEVETVDWLGTSMGGLIGMTMAALAKTPIRRLVVNDVGPLIAKEGLQRIGNYVGKIPDFASLDEALGYMAGVTDELRTLDQAARRAFALHALKQRADGRWTLRYDPGIALPFQEGPLDDIDLWAVWDKIRCPTLVLRGEKSDLLRPETASEMTRRGPRAELVEVPGCGHPPPLTTTLEIGAVRAFLDA